MRRPVVTALVGFLLFGGCGSIGDDVALLEDQPILEAPIAGTTNGRTAVDRSAATVTRLYDIGADWNAVSVAVADAVVDDDWAIEALKCVGTGNDVIARKQVDGHWLLLESGAGTRGAGLILSFADDERGPSPLTVTGRCAPALIDAAGG